MRIFDLFTGRLAAFISLLIVILLAFGPFALGSYQLHIMIVSFYYVVLVSSWNLLAGYTGQFSLAHHAFATIGGYSSGLLIYHFDTPIWLSILAAPIVTFLLGLFLGLLVLRMRTIYLAIATWAFGEVFRVTISANYVWTRGDAGLSVPSLFGLADLRPYYYLFLVLMILALIFMRWLVLSPVGSFMRAIKDDELAAQAMGVNTVRWKLFIFSITSCIAGTIGVFYAHYIALISPVTMRFTEMGKIVIMATIGGLGSFIGPIIGAPLVQNLFEWTREYGEWRMVVFALIVIVIMRVERGGVVSLVQRLWGVIRG